ncbi:hypothetical protein HUJ04_006715 [Dendroctonus ponderosae]|nr:hypothetical protein HUJ04_006715 [Dendroctonus ponderosae]
MATLLKLSFQKELHKKYLNRFLNGRMPSFLANMDSNRSIVLYFCVSGLDILGDIDDIPEERKNQMIDWLYSLQVEDDGRLASCIQAQQFHFYVMVVSEPVSGFQGSTTINTREYRGKHQAYQWGHIATTYSCLLSLLILGDDLKRVNTKEIIKSLRPLGLRALQLDDGSYKGAIDGAESDMRFVFCAAAISYILNNWSGIDIEKMLDFILKSISYDGGIGQGPDLESHCGSTFCAIAALALSNNLHILSQEQFKNLRRWLLSRLEIDTCYSFWTGGALKLLNAYQFIESDDNPNFVLMTQDKYGGFSKWVNSASDPMHTYFGLAGLSLMNYGDLNEMFPALNCTSRIHSRIKKLHLQWE